MSGNFTVQVASEPIREYPWAISKSNDYSTLGGRNGRRGKNV